MRHLKLGNNSPEYSATLVRLVHVYKQVRVSVGVACWAVRHAVLLLLFVPQRPAQLEKETAMDWEGLDKADKDFST